MTATRISEVFTPRRRFSAPRCSNCAWRVWNAQETELVCPHRTQLCDHAACTRHRDSIRWMDILDRRRADAERKAAP